MREIWRALNLSDEDFKSEFKFMKPAVDATSIVLYCLKGKRAQAAADKMSLLGYTPKVYSGSFHDWKEQGGKILQNNKKGNKKNKS